jgi:hypothetical protein
MVRGILNQEKWKNIYTSVKSMSPNPRFESHVCYFAAHAPEADVDAVENPRRTLVY